MTDIEPLDIEAIEARANAATPGPWHITTDPGDIVVWATNEPEDSNFVGNVGGGRVQQCVIFDCDVANGEFIAHARTDVPALVAEVRKLQRIVMNSWKLTRTVRDE
jgi:hypothetical protein